MEEKINIAEILKDKPQGTKLYNLLYNIDVELDTIVNTGTKTIVLCTDKIDNNDVCYRFYSEFGTIEGYPDGLQILLPSKEMRDWSKFNWKRGDVLVSNDGKVKVIFDKFISNTYLSFIGKYHIDSIECNNPYYQYEGEYATGSFKLEEVDAAQAYINTIEERLGGKLNRETLKIEKAQPEFKDGDIVVYKCEIDDVPSTIFIFRGISQRTPYYSYYASLDSDGFLSYKLGGFGIYKRELRLATEEEKEQLFSALEKKRKAWDAEKKAIVNLESVVELKPFDKVLVRDSKSDNWRANLFGYIGKKDGYYHCVYANWAYCIPYIGNESLLGTTKDVDGKLWVMKI